MADTTLVEGAYRAAMGESRLGAAKGLTKITSIVAEGAAKVIKSRAKEFDKAAKEARDRIAGAASSEQLADLYDEFGGANRDKFIWGNKKKRAVILKDMSNKSVEIAGDSVDTKEWAEGAGDINDDFTKTLEGESITGIWDGTNKRVWNDETNQYGYMIDNSDAIRFEITGLEEKRNELDNIPEEERSGDYLEQYLDLQNEINAKHKNLEEGGSVWMSRNEIGDIIKNNTIDSQTKTVMTTAANNVLELASKVEKGGSREFNYNFYKNWSRLNIVEEGNVRSLTKDRGVLVNGRVFYDDLQEAIMNETYGDLGIGSDNVIDPTPEDGITDEDARNIADGLLTDDNITKEYLTAYATNHLQKQWEAGLPGGTGSTEETIDEGDIGEGEAGGTIVDGVYVTGGPEGRKKHLLGLFEQLNIPLERREKIVDFLQNIEYIPGKQDKYKKHLLSLFDELNIPSERKKDITDYLQKIGYIK